MPRDRLRAVFTRDTEVFRPIVENLTQHDRFLVVADYADSIALPAGRSVPPWLDTRGMDPQVDPEFRTQRQVLSDRSIGGVLRGHLGCRTGCRRGLRLRPITNPTVQAERLRCHRGGGTRSGPC